MFARPSFSRSRRAALTFAACLCLGAAQLGGGLVAGCGATTGKRITLETRAVATEGAAPFENDYGWSITLTRAHLSVGALYYFTGPPVVAALPPARGPRRGLRDLLSIPQAHAHPGHYTQGEALGQMLEPGTIDLLVESTLADAEAVTGHYESALFTFQSPPAGDLAAGMEGHVVWIEGEATKGDTTLLFRGTADEADVLDDTGSPVVSGCVFEIADVEDSGVVTLTVHPAVWLDQVDFGAFTPPAAGERLTLDEVESEHNAFTRGLKKGTAYDFSYSE